MLYIYIFGHHLVPYKETKKNMPAAVEHSTRADDEQSITHIDSEMMLDDSYPRWSYRRRICQAIALIASTISACNALALWLLFNSAFGAAFDFTFCIMHLAAFYWINSEKYTASAYWTTLLAALQITAGSILFVGAGTGFHFYLLCMPAIVYLLLPNEPTWRKTGLVVLGFILFMMTELAHIPRYLVEISAVMEKSLYFINIIVTVGTNYFAIKFFTDDSTSAFQKQKELLLSDNLTGLSNRRFVVRYANKLLALCQRYQHPLSIIMLDVDHFKQVNDTYGHSAGDDALLLVADCLRDHLRSADIAARYGGEEFMVLLPETSQIAANNIAEQLRKALEKSSLLTDGSKISITASFGVSCCQPGDKCTVVELVKDADDALYQAKNAGRNQVVSSSRRRR